MIPYSKADPLYGPCSYCGRRVRVSKWSGNVLTHVLPEPGRGRCPGSYKKPTEEKEGTK